MTNLDGTTHLDDGMLMAVRDGDSVQGSAEARSHLDACSACQEALQRAHGTREAVTAALAALDEPFDAERSREAVRRRVAVAAAKDGAVHPISRRLRFGGSALARAAGLVLITAIGASALPGSPVRNWVDALLSPGGESSVSVAPTATTPEATTGDAGIRVPVSAPIRVMVHGLEPEEEVSVVWMPGPDVAVFAASGSRFSSQEGRVEAVVTGGPVRIELPTSVRPLTLEVGGRVWLRSMESGVEFLVRPRDEGDRTLVFTVPPGGP